MNPGVVLFRLKWLHPGSVRLKYYISVLVCWRRVKNVWSPLNRSGKMADLIGRNFFLFFPVRIPKPIRKRFRLRVFSNTYSEYYSLHPRLAEIRNIYSEYYTGNDFDGIRSFTGRRKFYIARRRFATIRNYPLGVNA